MQLFVRRPGRREDRARRDRVHENLITRELERQSFSHRDCARLGDVVRQVARIARTSAHGQPVGEVDDAPPALLPHVRDRGTGAEERRAQIDIDGGVPRMFVELVDRRRDVHGRHVDEDVQPSESGRRALDERAAVAGIGEVRACEVRAAPGPRDVSRRCLGLGA